MKNFPALKVRLVPKTGLFLARKIRPALSAWESCPNVAGTFSLSAV